MAAMVNESSDNSFDLWLTNLCAGFNQLTDLQKNTTLDHFIRISGPEQLRFLSTKLEVLLKRDFLKCLPLELVYHVLKWLDPRSLCTCCLVSKKWNKVINSCDDAWQRACKHLQGIRVDIEENESVSWKLVYLKTVQRMKTLKNKSAFETSTLYGHSTRVFALHYKGNLLASGSDDRSVRLWDLTPGQAEQCRHVLIAHTCADIKFDEQKVLTASFDTTIGLWEWDSGRRLQTYQGHTGAVFCVDYDEDLDLVVSGSADMSVKLWRMSTAECLVTRPGHSDWVTKVILRRVEVDSRTHKKGSYAILSMDKRTIKVWSCDHSERTCLATLSCGQTNSLHLQPRLQFDGHQIACSSDIGIFLWNFADLQCTRLFGSMPGMWLVSYGPVFSILLDTDNLYIMKTKSESCLTKWHLAPFRKSNRGSSFLPGDTHWLKGFDSEDPRGMVFATSMPDHSVNVIRWKQPLR